MEFGRVSHYARVDYRLPSVSRESVASEGSSFRLDYGGPVWNCADWVGSVYPAGSPRSRFLRLYSDRFPAVELNSTHYCVPAPSQAAVWAQATRPGFRFYPKFPQEVSHRFLLMGKVREARLLTREFFRFLDGFGDRLGVPFLQLPPSFERRQLPVLEAYTRGWPTRIPLAIEWRSPDAFVGGRLDSSIVNWMRARGFGTVVTDTPGRRDVCHSSLTASFVVVRFVGNALHESDDLRCVAWIEQLQAFRQAGVATVAFFVHQPENIATPEFLRRFVRQAARGLSLSAPAEPSVETQLSWAL